MKSVILGLLAETFIHPGGGQSTGTIDLPVSREAATDYPYIAGSSLKGALLDMAKQKQLAGRDELFGKQESAGQLLVSDARLLLLPVRSLTGSYKWATCPHLLERLQRDMDRSGRTVSFTMPQVGDKNILTQGSGKIFLEERGFNITAAPGQAIIDAIKPLIFHDTTRERLSGRLAILPDDDFTWFARYGLAVQARNQLNDNKTSNNLWYEETLPPDTVMYMVLSERKASMAQAAMELFNGNPYLQTGGNETVGQGWFVVKPLNGGES